MKKNPKVSVCVVSYNQEKYIRQCLQSIIDQETDFNYEIIVADDCSSDGTRNIVWEFAKKYPKIFRLFFHNENIGAYSNFRFVHEQAIGQYVAHIDGDDYTLPGKLQAQVDILDNDESCNLVWTPVLIETVPGKLHEQNSFFRKHALNKRYTRADLIKYGTIGTNSSKMYRKNIGVELKLNPPPGFDLIDYFVNVIQVGDGVARFTGEKPLGVYRLGIGIASNGNKTKILTLRSIEYFSKIFKKYRLECNVASGFRLLSDIKNNSATTHESFEVFVKTFHWKVFFFLLREFIFVKYLTLRD